ncbi:hypothetical protein PROFUN_16284, partial [Planoprotostelium fungivorum]
TTPSQQQASKLGKATKVENAGQSANINADDGGAQVDPKIDNTKKSAQQTSTSGSNKKPADAPKDDSAGKQPHSEGKNNLKPIINQNPEENTAPIKAKL